MRKLCVVLALVGSVAPAAAEVGPPVDVASRARGAGKVVVAASSTFGPSLKPTSLATS